jgi:23S rRNA (cytosine1962-C5)-methyltransferase
VIQAHSIGMVQHFDDLSKALQKVYGDGLKAVYDKSAETLPKNLPGIQNK